jgi:hypothetical protein
MAMSPSLAQNRRRGFLITAIVFLILLTAPAALVGLYSQTYNTLTTQEVTKEQTLSDVAALALKVKLDKLVNIASSLASSPQLASDAKNGQWTDAANAARDMENNVNFYDPFIDRIIIYDASGTQQAAYPALTGGLGTNASSSAWYAALANSTQSFYVTNATRRLSLPQIQVVSIAVPIKTGQENTGFLVLQIPTDNFLEFAGNLDLGTYGFGYVVDAIGNIVAHPKVFSDSGSVVSYSFVPEVQKVIAGESGTDIVSNQRDDEKSIITYKPVADYRWGIITQELYSEAFSTRSGILSGLGILMAVLIVMDALVSYLVFRILISRKHDQV